jgi:hypothetical protein
MPCNGLPTLLRPASGPAPPPSTRPRPACTAGAGSGHGDGEGSDDGGEPGFGEEALGRGIRGGVFRAIRSRQRCSVSDSGCLRVRSSFSSALQLAESWETEQRPKCCTCNIRDVSRGADGMTPRSVITGLPTDCQGWIDPVQIGFSTSAGIQPQPCAVPDQVSTVLRPFHPDIDGVELPCRCRGRSAMCPEATCSSEMGCFSRQRGDAEFMSRCRAHVARPRRRHECVAGPDRRARVALERREGGDSLRLEAA